MTPAGVIDTRYLFRPLHEELGAVLRSLSAEDWQKPTICRGWAVRDLATHLLDGDLRRLSITRDGHVVAPDRAIESYRDVVDFLNGLNATWVSAARRLSPRVLIDLLAVSGAQAADYFESQDLHAPAPFPVAWAGETASAMWFDIAREYTERWHHQQQIRDAVGAKPLTGSQWLLPVLDTFLRALPHAYRAMGGGPLVFTLTGDAGGHWSLLREADGWRLYYGESEEAAMRVAMDADVAWRLFTKGVTPEEARAKAAIRGDGRLADPFFGLVAVMA